MFSLVGQCLNFQTGASLYLHMTSSAWTGLNVYKYAGWLPPRMGFPNLWVTSILWVGFISSSKKEISVSGQRDYIICPTPDPCTRIITTLFLSSCLCPLCDSSPAHLEFLNTYLWGLVSRFTYKFTSADIYFNQIKNIFRGSIFWQFWVKFF